MEEKAERLPKGVLTARVACLRMIFIWPVACWGCVLVMPYPSILQGIIRLFFFLFPGSQPERKHKACSSPEGAGARPGCRLLTFLPASCVRCQQARSGRAARLLGLCWG